MKIGFISLGCPKNQVDTEVMLALLQEAGHTIVTDETQAEAVILNTCAFIESAKQEAIDNILDIAWLKKNKSLKYIVVTGCLAQRYQKDILQELPEVDALLGTGSVHQIVACIESLAQKKDTPFCSFAPPKTALLGGKRVLSTKPYAYLKIAEGCDNHCTYCAIPALRGPFRSRPIEALVEEAKLLEAEGVKELVLVAQDTTRYGLDLYGEQRLSALLEALCAQTSIPWFRLLYCYPDEVDQALIDTFANNPRLCKYIDLPIQHCNDRILSAMHRHGDKQQILDTISALRTVPGMTLRSTVICGFPTETQAEFEELCAFLDTVKFERLGAFAYSQEEHTVAGAMQGQIDAQTKQDRADHVMELATEHAFQQNEALLGQTVVVLCEDYDPVAGVYYGRTEAQAPEIDNKTYFVAKKGAVKCGQFVQVELLEATDYDLLGRAIQILPDPQAKGGTHL